jgi:uncharacterized protein (DUF302 family)
MSFIRNLFALIGFIFVAVVVAAVVRYQGQINNLVSFDDKAGAVYLEMAQKILETGNAAEATVWKVPVAEGLSPADVDDVIKFVANERNIKNVGELPLSQQVSAMSGKEYRYVKIYMFCNALTAANMMEYSDAYSAYLPCRITLLEDKTGKLWIYTLNMDLMIHGGHPLPPDLKQEALGVKETMLNIMQRASKGEF